MFSTLLIANRGEIACRVATTARRLGIKTVAIYSDADVSARHVAACDLALHVGGAEPQASYLCGETILRIAREVGAQAIHPGYGFLSENETFARAVIDAGLVFVGPPPSAIAAMGSKSAAKALMASAGVPLVAGYHGGNQDPHFLQTQADLIGYPVLIKASAGGGGKGMRVVASAADFLEALASCRREAVASFGNDEMLIERYLQKPRHIEIQVFADTHGNYVYLFERDCSVQRRHQKVIEEAPAPGMTAERRRAMGEAAVAAARAVGYVGAGTVEFITEPDGRFYFMEMNTRLQVEHPVTEMITGHDLVEWQLRVAAGEPLPARQQDLHIQGHAMEARIYAENPAKGFLPSIGTVAYLALPPHTSFNNGDIRVDGGVRMGDVITPYYDPMIAKLIVRGDDRDHARARMAQALAATQVVGVQTNVALLQRLMHDEAFAQAELDTALIERRHATLLAPPAAAEDFILAAATAAALAWQGLLQATASDIASDIDSQVSVDPWQARDGWRLGDRYSQTFNWRDLAGTRPVIVMRNGLNWSIECGQGSLPFRWLAQHTGATSKLSHKMRVQLGGRESEATVVRYAGKTYVFHDGVMHTLELEDPGVHVYPVKGDEGDGLTAPMPGKIISMAVQVGDVVTQGQSLLVLEAMKMEHTIMAAVDGKVEEIFYAVGDQVAEGAALISISQ